MHTITDAKVWNSVRWLYMGSGVLFLANIGLGILNVFTPGEISRGQVLSHFHAGTIGWITLGVIATTIWLFMAGREAPSWVSRFIAGLTILALLSVAGYIAAFGLAFNQDVGYWILPIFGIPSWLVIVAATVFAGTQLKKQPVVTAVHVLLFCALLVGSFGGAMGVIQGIYYTTGSYPGPAGADGLGAHAGPMEMYLGLAFAALLEFLVGGTVSRRWTRPAMAQASLAVAGAVIGSAALYANLGQLVPLSLGLYLVSFGFYFARVGWRSLRLNPMRPGRNAAVFWAGLAYPVYVLAFVYLVAVYFVPDKPVPHAFEVIFVHTAFIGAGTNLLLATQSLFAGGPQPVRWVATATWALNLGMLAFFAGEVTAERREGALLMAAGVLAALVVVWTRLGARWHPAPAPPETAPSS